MQLRCIPSSAIFILLHQLMKNTKKIYFLLIFVCLAQPIDAAVRLHAIFSDHMVLQRDCPVKVWGWADAGEKVSVSFKGVKKVVKAGDDHTWAVTFPPSAFGGPYTLSVSASNQLLLKDVLVGDVWFCSGQSNMDMGVAGANNAEAELKDTDYPGIRLYTVTAGMSEAEQDNTGKASWTPSSPGTVAGFSAVGYFFGRELNRKLKVPVGLIKCAWSGTNIQTWMGRGAIAAFDTYAGALNDLKTKSYKKLSEKRDQDYSLWNDTLHNLEQGTLKKWYLPQTDDSAWSAVDLPFVWNAAGYKGNGVGWFRKEFSLTKEETTQTILFMLGRIHTGEEVYLNGEKIGQCYVADQQRIYAGAPPSLKEGKNSIAIKVYNEWGEGGFSGKPGDIYMRTNRGDRPLFSSWKFKPGHLSINPVLSVHPNNYPTLLYNAMVSPFTKFAIKGVLWYQGENNSDEPKAYKQLLPALINDWRRQWKLQNLPFLIVQIPNFMHDGDMPPANCNWALLREAQMGALQLPHTGMAVTIDLGDPDNIHPRNKQDVAHRLLLQSLRLVYGENVVSCGPTFKRLELMGNKAVVHFDHIGKGLMTRDKYGYVKGFAIAGADRKFYWAKATIIGDAVELYSEKVDKPVAVRYAWSFSPGVTLYNFDGLPAVPFRTDDYE